MKNHFACFLLHWEEKNKGRKRKRKEERLIEGIRWGKKQTKFRNEENYTHKEKKIHWSRMEKCSFTNHAFTFDTCVRRSVKLLSWMEQFNHLCPQGNPLLSHSWYACCWEKYRSGISLLFMRVELLGCHWIRIFSSLHRRRRGGRKFYRYWVTFLSYQCPVSPKPVLKEGKLGAQQRHKEGQGPEFPFHAAARCGPASKRSS